MLVSAQIKLFTVHIFVYSVITHYFHCIMVLHKIFFCLLLFYFLYKNDSPDNGYVLDEQYTVTENK